jgi:peptidoglycan endopeptidase LytF/peptidoglycan endopeptidase LytE
VAVKAGPVTDQENIAWYQISASNVSGWAMAQYLAQASAPAQSSSKAAPKATPTSRKLSGFARVANTDGDNLNVRAEPNRNSKVVATLPPNTSVAVKAGPVNDNAGVAWYQISANSVTGWAMAQYLEQADAPPQAAPKAQPASSSSSSTRSGSSRGSAPSAQVESSDKGSRIVNIAMQYVGYRYRYGGSSPSGFDCSGFVYYVLNKAGVPVGRSMEAQLNSGPRVSSKSLEPGDLVFFVNTYKRGLSHAGIYIGNGKFVHAENESTGVVVSALWSSYWAGHYYTAVRP